MRNFKVTLESDEPSSARKVIYLRKEDREENDTLNKGRKNNCELEDVSTSTWVTTSRLSGFHAEKSNTKARADSCEANVKLTFDSCEEEHE